MAPHQRAFVHPLSKETDNLISVSLAAAELYVSRRAVLYRIRRGRLRAQKIGGKWWIDRDALNR